MRKLTLLILPLLLAACATPEQRAQQVLAEFGPYCERLGYTRNTDPWRQCVQIEDANASAGADRAYWMMRGFPCSRRSAFC